MRKIDDTKQIFDLLRSSTRRDEMQNILSSYYTVDSQLDRRVWSENTVEKIIDLAEPIPSESSSFFPDRAYCPLCGDGSVMTRYESGFSIPVGLRRHLLGWGDHVQQCRVMSTVMEIAQAYWHNKFYAAEVAEETQEWALVAQRKNTETLYRVTPHSDPKLIDEGISFDHRLRNEEELAWAEQRLKDLGFRINNEGNIKSYTGEVGDIVVYADPREKGKIIFCIYSKRLLVKNRASLMADSIPKVFHFMDRWKHDIQSKYERRLKEAIRR